MAGLATADHMVAEVIRLRTELCRAVEARQNAQQAEDYISERLRIARSELTRLVSIHLEPSVVRELLHNYEAIEAQS